MRDLAEEQSVLLFESKQETKDASCPHCRGKVYADGFGRVTLSWSVGMKHQIRYKRQETLGQFFGDDGQSCREYARVWLTTCERGAAPSGKRMDLTAIPYVMLDVGLCDKRHTLAAEMASRIAGMLADCFCMVKHHKKSLKNQSINS